MGQLRLLCKVQEHSYQFETSALRTNKVLLCSFVQVQGVGEDVKQENDVSQHIRTSKPEVPASVLLSRRATMPSETERTASAAAPSRFSASMELLASACERRRRSASWLSCSMHTELVRMLLNLQQTLRELRALRQQKQVQD